MGKEIDTNIPFIRNLQMAAEAHDEMDIDPLFEILNPKEDSREMGKTFIYAIGYNPITYYTEKAASDVFYDAEEMLADYPRTVEKLKEIEDSIIAELVDHTETTRAQYAYFGIKGKIRNMIRELGEVPNAKIDEVMDALERKYNLNYKERKQPDAPMKPVGNQGENRDRQEKMSDRGTSFELTREHPVKLRDLPNLTEVDEIDDLEKENFGASLIDDDDDDARPIFPDDDDQDDDRDEVNSNDAFYSYDAFDDDDDEPRLQTNEYFI